MRLLLLGLIGALLAPPAAAQQPAATLADQRANAQSPADLDTLMRLQLAAGRWQAAEATIERLAAAQRAIRPWRVVGFVPWRVYARAKRYESEGLVRSAALRRAFAETFAALPDEEVGNALALYGTDFDRLRDAQTRAAAACANVAIDVCPAAAALITARQTWATWTYLMPASQPLIRAELERRFIVQDDLLIPMPDGARVAAVLVRPRNSQGKLTALLNFTIYARDDWAMSDAVEMAARGYAGIVAFTRGKGRGEGPVVPYLHDGPDAAAVIDWLAAQGWSDGRVGMFSGSYNAFTQWGALKQRPRALRAIATHGSNAPGIDSPMMGNVFRNFAYSWPHYTTATPGLDDVNYGDSARWAALDRTWYLTGRPYRDLEKIDGQPNPVFRSWLDHPSYDSFWQRLIPVGQEFARIDIPVFVQTGYYDGGMIGAMHYFREHLRHRPNADHRMLVGPYHHFAMAQGALLNVNGFEVDRAALIDLKAIRLQWFDHVFRGAPLPAILSGRINFQLMGANSWRHVDSLSEMAPEPLRLYLSGVRDAGLLRLRESRPAAASPPVELSVNFADRSDIDLQIPQDQLDTRNALVFATAPFAGPTEVAGAFTGRFELVINKRDVDLEISFFEQRADGRYFPLADHIGRASYMADRSRRQLLVPGRPQMLSFESQRITARRMEAGSRIVALVAVPKRPDTQINYGTGRDVSDESIADAGEPLRLSLRPGSYLELRVRR